MQTTDPLSATFGALADPTRRAILSRLSSGEATVNELSAPFDMSLQAVSRHLKVLERAGLITRRRDAQFRPCRFAAEPLEPAVDWIVRHRRIWEERCDQLEQHLADLQRANPAPVSTDPPAEPVGHPAPELPPSTNHRNTNHQSKEQP